MLKYPAVVVMMLFQTIFSVLLFVVVDSLLLLVLFVVISLFTQQTHSYRDGCSCIPVLLVDVFVIEFDIWRANLGGKVHIV